MPRSEDDCSRAAIRFPMQTGRENKPHIGIYGRCNAGKSSLLNFITGADTAIVSPEAGTTTDVVRKSYEILGFAPVIWLDTAGVDDRSELGRKRVTRTWESLLQVDLALLVFRQWGDPEKELVRRFEQLALPYILVYNGRKGELSCGEDGPGKIPGKPDRMVLEADLLRPEAEVRDRLLEAVRRQLPERACRVPSMFEGRVEAGDRVILVCPIDSEAPAGRLILPQVQAIRELLDRHAVPVVVQPDELAGLFAADNRPSDKSVPPLFSAVSCRPKLVVTDSQVFARVRAVVPQEVEVTSFSILLAAAKGDFDTYKKGLERVDTLREGDRVLIAENCTHQVSCEDIGRKKIPRWLENYSGCRLHFTFVSGLEPFPEDLADYALVVQCGGCMVTRSQVQGRIRTAVAAGVAITNYGMLIRKVTLPGACGKK